MITKMSQPDPLAKYMDLWNLSFPSEIAKTPTSEAYKVLFQQKFAVLKVLTPSGIRFESGSSEFLSRLKGRGTVELLAATDGALLLEYLDGTELTSLVRESADLEAAKIVCRVADQIHHASIDRPTCFENLRERFQSLFLRSRKEDSESVFSRTARVAEEILASEADKCLLHGDLHHANILKSSKRGWLAIDPQGLYGERAFDFANMFFNPPGLVDLGADRGRVEGLASLFSDHLQISRRRMLQFAYAYGGLSASWQLDDGEDPGRRIRVTELIGSIL